MQRSYERKKTRLSEWNYSDSGWYFVTICVQDRECVFGKISDEKMTRNLWGEVAVDCWKQIPERFPGAEIDEFIIMPNHVHGIVVLKDENCRGRRSASPAGDRSKMLLSKIIHGFKSSVSRKVHKISDEYFAWQKSFHDRIIRDERKLNNIRHYIHFNASKWCDDEFFQKIS